MKLEFRIIEEKIKKARTEANLTQRELAEICNISEKTISRAENEASILDFETLLFITSKLNIKIENFAYKKAFSIEEAWSVIEDVSKGVQIKVSPVNYSIEKLDIVIRILEILERDLKTKSSSVKLRAQRSLILENEKLNKIGGEGYFTTFYEEGVKILNLYFLNNNSEKIKKENERKYIDVFKELSTID